MRRFIGGSAAFVVLTGTLLVLPVYAAPLPDAEPVAPSIQQVDLGSVEVPAPSAVVATDTQVVAVGDAASVEVGTSLPQADAGEGAAAPDGPSAVPGASDVADSVPVLSGDEDAGVPALAISDPGTQEFSAVGVTWAHDETISGVQVRLRVQTAPDVWGEWTTLEQDDVEQTDSGSTRDGTAPYFTGPATGVQVVVQGIDGSVPQDVQTQLIDPGDSPADDVAFQAPAAQANAAGTMPAIYSRAQWGADESIRTWDPEYAPTIKAATIHHTADSNNYTAAQVPGIMRSIYAFHTISRGWGDIGYNVIVDQFGRAWEGRYGGLASTVIGAHAGGFNSSTFGVSMLGNYDVASPSAAMLETVSAVIAWKLSLYGVDPNGTTTLTSGGGGTSRYAAGVRVTLPTIFAHRDVGSTACPGRYAYSQMDLVRAKVTAKMSSDATIDSPGVLQRYSNTSGSAQAAVTKGIAGDVPLVCDWDGDGRDSLSVFRAGRFILFDSDAPGARPFADFWLGDGSDTPLCGDWDGDGKDTVGVWRAGTFFLKNTTSGGIADGSFTFGPAGGQPLVGDWNGDGYDTVAVYSGAVVSFTNSNIRPSVEGRMAFGVPTDRAVAGNWDGDAFDSVGVYRGGRYFLSNSNLGGRTDVVVDYGGPTDRGSVGDWTGRGTDTVGVGRGY